MPPGPPGKPDLLGLVALAGCLLLLAAATGPAEPVTAAALDIPGPDGEIPAHLYRPPGEDRHPAVLVLHTAAGPGPNVEAVARRLAAAGYVTLTPDLFGLHDFGAGGRVDHPLVLGDAAAALAFLGRHPRVEGGRVGVVGFSFGGRVAVLLAAGSPDRLRAVVVYYAVTDFRKLGRPLAGRMARAESLAARVPALRAPVQIHHGAADSQVPVDQGRMLHAALQAAGRAGELHVYPGADHLFDFRLGPDARFHPEAAGLAWDRTLGFLDRHLKDAR